MANHKSALKRIRQSAVRRDRNKYYHKSARTAIKALRSESDKNEAETVFLTTSAENMYLSSSVVKQIASFGGDISHFVPEEIHNFIKNRLIKGV